MEIFRDQQTAPWSESAGFFFFVFFFFFLFFSLLRPWALLSPKNELAMWIRLPAELMTMGHDKCGEERRCQAGQPAVTKRQITKKLRNGEIMEHLSGTRAIKSHQPPFQS